MATKRPTPLHNPPSASSSSSETEEDEEQETISLKSIQDSSSEEEQESESEDEEAIKHPKIQNPDLKSAQLDHMSSDSESDDEIKNPQFQNPDLKSAQLGQLGQLGSKKGLQIENPDLKLDQLGQSSSDSESDEEIKKPQIGKQDSKLDQLGQLGSKKSSKIQNPDLKLDQLGQSSSDSESDDEIKNPQIEKQDLKSGQSGQLDQMGSDSESDEEIKENPDLKSAQFGQLSSDSESDEEIKNPQIENQDLKLDELGELGSEEDESGSDSEEEDENQEPKTKTINLNSSSMFEFDGDGDGDVRSPTASDFAIKPSKKIKEKTPTSKLKLKRANSGSENKSSKKVKVFNGEVDEEKKSVVKRVWSVDDELLLLKGFIDYQLEIGCSPLSDMDGFYKFTMSLVPGYASKSQLYEKVRRLKKKFRVNSEKAGKGEDLVFLKPHDRKLFELSSKIWGVNGCENVSGGGGGRTPKVKTPKVVKTKTPEVVKTKVVVNEMDDEDDEKVAEMLDFETLYPYWNAGLTSEVSSALKFPAGVVSLVKENLSLIGEAKAKELNEKWEAVFKNEAVLRKRRIALLSKIGDMETA